MAKQIVTWCDPHLADNNEQREAVEYPIQVGDMKQLKGVDLCQECFDRLLAPVLELAAAYGKEANAPILSTPKRQKSGAMEKLDGPYYCRVPDCTGYNANGYKSRSRLRGHLHSTHDMTYPEYEEQYGPVTPGGEPPERVERAAPIEQGKAVCPECGKDYSDSGRPAQALGAHRAQAHGVRGERRKETAVAS